MYRGYARFLWTLRALRPCMRKVLDAMFETIVAVLSVMLLCYLLVSVIRPELF